MGMTKPELTAIVHVFSNGAGLIEFDEQVRPEQIDNFKQYWQSAQRKERGAAIHMVGGVRLTIVEHQNPLGPDFTFDAISHAFGALGEYKEDEEIEAFVEALKTFAAET
jgi:hypothetical protein